MQVSVKHDNIVDCSTQMAIGDSGKEAARQHASLDMSKDLPMWYDDMRAVKAPLSFTLAN